MVTNSIIRLKITLKTFIAILIKALYNVNRKCTNERYMRYWGEKECIVRIVEKK